MYDVCDVEFSTLWTKPVRLAASGRDDQMIRGPEASRAAFVTACLDARLVLEQV